MRLKPRHFKFGQAVVYREMLDAIAQAICDWDCTGLPCDECPLNAELRGLGNNLCDAVSIISAGEEVEPDEGEGDEQGDASAPWEAVNRFFRRLRELEQGCE